jgi:hypothetical protein
VHVPIPDFFSWLIRVGSEANDITGGLVVYYPSA